MIVSPIVQREFDKQYPYIELVSKKVRETIFNYCSVHGFAFIDRIKTVNSLSEKIETGRFKKWSDIDDFYAATIIIPNLNLESKIIDFLKTTFQKVDFKKRGNTLKAPDVFRFDNTRFVGKLIEVGIKSELSNINFEVQIKTAFEHAWSVSTHSLVYKANEIDWKLLRIASQLKSSVEQLDMIVSGVNHLNSHIIEHKWPDLNLKQHILVKTNEFLSNPNVPQELIPKDSSRFSENLHSFFNPLLKDSKHPNRLLEPFFTLANTFANDLTIEKFPRSISLIQFFIGIAQNLNYTNESEKYIPLITMELETIFPKVQLVLKRFQI